MVLYEETAMSPFLNRYPVWNVNETGMQSGAHADKLIKSKHALTPNLPYRGIGHASHRVTSKEDGSNVGSSLLIFFVNSEFRQRNTGYDDDGVLVRR